MKKLLSLVSISIVFLLNGYGQVIDDLEMANPFQEGLASVKKGDHWGFIDEKGDLVIKYRDDLVPSPSASGLAASEQWKSYPAFTEERCLIHEVREGIEYFGFIDKEGRTVIEPQYVNATNFKNGHAIVTQYTRQVVGRNELLGKDVVNYQVEELIIDKSGKVVTSLMNARNFVPSKVKKTPPDMQARFLGKGIVAVQGEEGKWAVYKFD